MDKAVTMKTKVFAVCALLFFSLFAVSCDDVPKGDYKSFDYKLQGTWESETGNAYQGKLIIGFDTIKIKGYEEKDAQTEQEKKQLPFKGYPRDITFNGYSEEGKIFFDYGNAKNGISYAYYQETFSPYSETLSFTFNGRDEILKKTNNRQ